MRHRTLMDTDWHDGPYRITVPAGEIVDVIETDLIPADEGRWEIADGIRRYAEHGRKCVAISIRDWFALIDANKLELVKTGPTPQLSRPAPLRPRLVPGQRGYAPAVQ